MSKLTPRHKWCQTKIQDAFSPGLSDDTLERFMRNKANTEQFNAFFDGRQGPKLFIFYQVRFCFAMRDPCGAGGCVHAGGAPLHVK